jgi:hypothetical protein
MPPNNALEQAASAARPWQAAQGKTVARGGPRPVPRSPLLTASVTRATDVLSRNVGSESSAPCAKVQTTDLAAPKERAT